MAILVWFAVLFFVAHSAAAAPEWELLSDSYIDHINSKQTSWNAGRNFPKHTPLKHLKKLLGVPLSFMKNKKALSSLPSVKHDAGVIDRLPESFDSRQKWPNCPSLREIRDQGSCGSCWAFAAVEVMTDRVCIFSNGSKNFHFSARDLISCCDECGDGCHGGDIITPFEYWRTDGIVSGGNYNSSQGCEPYSFPPCVHHGPNQQNQTVNPVDDIMPCFDNYLDTPECSQKCDEKYGVLYENDKSYANDITLVLGGEDHIKAEVYLNGPVETSLYVYKDFFNYKSGVYIPVDSELVGGHAVKILGWGVENGTKYWQIANSWNDHWGDNGFFKIRRGKNDCEIESLVTAAEPEL